MKERKGISGSTLKIIAIITMLIDHIGAGVLGRLRVVRGMNEAADLNAWIDANSTLVITYLMMRFVGRLAFPIFCFLLIEGFEHTHDVKKYALRLLSFCLVSEIPFDLLFNGKILEFGYQNVFFTLFIGLMVMWGFQVVENQERFAKFKKVIFDAGILAAGILAAEFLNTDYAGIGVACIVLLYVFRKKKSYQLLAGCIGFSWELTAPLAFIPIAFYNGKRGLSLKYFFYIFYPAHLLILYIICWAMGMGPIAVA